MVTHPPAVVVVVVVVVVAMDVVGWRIVGAKYSYCSYRCCSSFFGVIPF
jgi:hypothetical protein